MAKQVSISESETYGILGARQLGEALFCCKQLMLWDSLLTTTS
jgi:hypothetical protein